MRGTCALISAADWLLRTSLLFVASTMGLGATNCQAHVDIRVSFKFILDANGNRPTGNLQTDDDVRAQVRFGNDALVQAGSELRIEILDIIEVKGISQWFSTSRDQVAALHKDALEVPEVYQWNNDAINIYINDASNGGMARPPPHNQIILIGNSCTADVVIHELGHALSLNHTFEEDYCADTIRDNASWSRDDIAYENFGQLYAALTPQQQALVDMVCFNIMGFRSFSYTETFNRLSHDQLNRMSAQAYADRGWIYSKEPVYVDSAISPDATQDGSFEQPFRSIDDALAEPDIESKVIVLQTGEHEIKRTEIDQKVEIVTRFASAETPCFLYKGLATD